MRTLALRAAPVALALLLPPAGAAAATWRAVAPERAPNPACVAVSGHENRYVELAPDDAAVLRLAGPRRVRILTRHLGPAAPGSAAWTLVVAIDGREVLRKRHAAAAAGNARPCAGEERVSASRSAYLDLPSGTHELRVTAAAEGGGRVVARFYRESRRRPPRDVPFAPESYRAARRLQLEAGGQSLWYVFGPGSPLRFTVNGPTTLRLYTRLDFDHTMNGAQTYTLAVARDGEPERTWHFSADRQDGAHWVGDDKVVPGQRRLLRIEVPRGRHRYAVRCVQSGECSVAAQILIPPAALGRTPAGGTGAR